MLLYVFEPGPRAEVEPVDAVVLAGIAAVVVDAAAGNDGDVGVLPDFKVVVDHVVDTAFGDHHRDVSNLPFGAGFDFDVNAGNADFRGDGDVVGGVLLHPFAVGPQVVGPIVELRQVGDGFKQVLHHG